MPWNLILAFISSCFKPAWWAQNRHLQTIWGALFRSAPSLPTMQRKRLELDDGDFIDIHIYIQPDRVNCAPTVLLLHGLEGSIHSSYIRGAVSQLVCAGYQVVVMHFRSCSEENNRLLQSYHSGVSDDLQLVIEILRRENIIIEYLVGFSLGGNVLLKWLGEQRQYFQVKAAVAISVPLRLDECATAIAQGFSQIYARHLLKTLKLKVHQKKRQFAHAISLTHNEIKRLASFWEFDDKVTAPIHGFSSAADYYAKVSSRQFLKFIEIPTLIIHAKDDPFMNEQVIPEATELSPKVTFELSERGGHVGFVEGPWPWKAEYYLEKRVVEFFKQQT